MLDLVLSAAGDVAGEAGGLALVAIAAGALYLITDPELRSRRRSVRRRARADRDFARRSAVR